MPFWLIVAVVGALGAMTVYMKNKMKAAKQGSAGLFLNKTALSAGIRMVYGERRVGALVAWKDVSIHGDQIPQNQLLNECDSFKVAPQEYYYSQLVEKGPDMLHRLDVWSLGEIDSITQFQIDGDSADDSRFNKQRAPYRMMNKHGKPSQTPMTTLVSRFYELNSNFKGNDVAYSWSRFWLPKKGDRQFQGEPELTAHIKGIKIWDPRLNPSDSSVKQWSSNPALILLDYLTAEYGKNLDVSDLDLQSFIDAADYCDVEETVPAVATYTPDEAAQFAGFGAWNWSTGAYNAVTAGSAPAWQRPWQGTDTVQKRFECNVVLEPKDGILDNVEKILTSMKASLIFTQGVYKLNIESPGTSVMSFDEDSMLSDITLGWAARSKRFNRVTIKFDNRSKEYTEDTVSFPEKNSVAHQAYLAEDNNEDLHKEVTLEGVVDYYQALDAAEFLVRESRNQSFITFVAQPTALALQPGDLIDVTSDSLNLTNKVYRLREMEVMSNLTCRIKAQEYDASVYAWDQTVTEPIVFKQPTRLFDIPSAPTGLNGDGLHEVNSDGTVSRKLRIYWDDIDTGELGAPVDRIIIGYKLTTDSEYSEVLLEPGSTEVLVAGTADVVTYDLRARFKNMIGNYSLEALQQVTIANINTTLLSIDQTARNSAASAVGIAASANGTASAASAAASTAQSAAATAQSSANSAASTAATASATANTANATANTANATANSAAADAAQALSDLSTVSTDLGTANSAIGALGIDITSNTNTITSLNGDVTTAQGTANTGVSNAATAQAAAVAAQGTADTASTSAGNAVSTAGIAINRADTALVGVQQHTSDIAALEQHYGITVTSQGYVSGFSLLNDGSASEFNIVADNFSVFNGTSLKKVFGVVGSDVVMQNLRVTNAVIDNLAITTAKIQDEAVTKFDAVTTNGNVNITPTGNSTLVSISVTPTSNGTIYVKAGAFVLASSAAGTTANMATGLNVRLLKDGVVQRGVSNMYSQGLMSANITLDSEHIVYAGNTYTYSFYMEGTGYSSGGAAYTVAGNSSIVYQLRYK
jgi:hypothetical protein